VLDADPDRVLERFAGLPAAQPVLGALAGAEKDVYLVGGGVRDLLLGLVPLDLDFMVVGPLEPLAELVGAPMRVHDRFSTATVEIHGFSYDLSSARRERYPHPGALPEVEPGTLAEDLARRDFTVNAIALAVGGPARGRLVGHSSALDDLATGTMRVHHETSFRDDPTRLLRLARYAARLGFSVEPHTHRLLENALGERALVTISAGRIGVELRLLAAEADPADALATLTGLGVAGALAPGFGVLDPSVVRLGLELLPADGDRMALALAGAALQVARPELEAFVARLALPAGERDRILGAATGAPALAARLQEASRPSEVAAAVGSAGPEEVALAGALGPDAVARDWLGRLRHVRLDIGGQDLLAAGMPRGPAIGQALAGALAAKLDGATRSTEDELAAAFSAAGMTPEH
jgi:tRNA nucleotidyltransferase (CCA-adding enzyme)